MDKNIQRERPKFRPKGRSYILTMILTIIFGILAVVILGIVVIVDYSLDIPRTGIRGDPDPLDEDGEGIMDDISAHLNPNADWVAGRAICRPGWTGPICDTEDVPPT